MFQVFLAPILILICFILFDVFCVLPQVSAESVSTSILTIKSLKKWVRAEFEVLKIFSKTILDEKSVHAKGNPFAQGVHDGGTLTSTRKYQAFGI
jgi:hypothetical protein